MHVINNKYIQAFQLGMYGSDYVWILHEIVGEPWWHKSTHECNKKQLQEVSENLLIVSSWNSIVSNDISYSGLVSKCGCGCEYEVDEEICFLTSINLCRTQWACILYLPIHCTLKKNYLLNFQHFHKLPRNQPR